MNVLEVSRLKKHISIGCVIFLSAIANALFFFLPVIPTLGQMDKRLGCSLCFFHTSNPSYFGEGTDPLGSFWIVKSLYMLTGQSDTFLSDLLLHMVDLGKHRVNVGRYHFEHSRY